MPRTKAMSTIAKELAKSYRPDQLIELSDLVKQEAAKPRLDKRVYSRMQREVKAAYVKKYQAEENLTVFLAEAGKSNDEINAEIETLKRDAEREAVSAPVAKAPGRRGGRRKAESIGEA